MLALENLKAQHLIKILKGKSFSPKRPENQHNANIKKIKRLLKWSPKVSFDEAVGVNDERYQR